MLGEIFNFGTVPYLYYQEYHLISLSVFQLLIQDLKRPEGSDFSKRVGIKIFVGDLSYGIPQIFFICLVYFVVN